MIDTHIERAPHLKADRLQQIRDDADALVYRVRGEVAEAQDEPC